MQIDKKDIIVHKAAMCTVCGRNTSTEHWVDKYVKDDHTGKTICIDQRICQPCKADLRKALKKTIMLVLPRALRESMLETLRNTA
jgi:hypothetical protein